MDADPYACAATPSCIVHAVATRALSRSEQWLFQEQFQRSILAVNMSAHEEEEAPDLSKAPFSEEQREWLSQLTRWVKPPGAQAGEDDESGTAVTEGGSSSSSTRPPPAAGE